MSCLIRERYDPELERLRRKRRKEIKEYVEVEFETYLLNHPNKSREECITDLTRQFLNSQKPLK